MGRQTEIAWTDHSFNSWKGCTKVSPACKFCYAETWGKRTGQATWGPSGTRNRTSASYWKQPIRWNREAQAEDRRARVFCASVADVFEGPETMPPGFVPIVEEARRDLWELIKATPCLDWLLLTKRPQNVLAMVPAEWIVGGAETVVVDPGKRLRDGSYLPALRRVGFQSSWPAHVWIGTSWEEQREDWRLDELEQIPAPVRFVSCEPLLGPLDLSRPCSACDGTGDYGSPLDGGPGSCPNCDGSGRQVRNIQWCIAGGESGPRARRTDPAWFDQLQDQCRRAHIPYHCKQAGTVLARELGLVHPKGGDLDELPERWRVREVPR